MNALPLANPASLGAYVPGSTVKYPTFTPDSPELFFLLMEATLKQQGIIDTEQVFLSKLMQLLLRDLII